MPTQPTWWQTAVGYQIYPRSFCDTTGDGIGDLDGIRRHLDHIADLGVDAVWLSPFFPSPMADYGYDVADFCDVDPMFGDLAVFDSLVAEAHQRGLRVIIDWVPNHTSDAHPWFVESRASRDNPRRDWYYWRDPAPDGGPPNNWIESLTFGPAWTFDPATGQYYLHCFLSRQPDLDWGNPEVVAAMHDTLRFWLDRGVDGFRMDVVHLIGKDPELPDEPAQLAGLPHTVLNDRPETHELVRGLRRLLDSYDGDRMAVGEVYLLDTDLVAAHYGDGDELHLCFNFPPLYAPFEADAWRHQIAAASAAHDPRNAWPTWVLSNHDNPRHRTRYGSDAAARAAAVLLLTLRGTPFLYAGEEVGMQDAVVAPERRHDPAGRDGCRAPIPWSAAAPHGWATADTWLPWPPDVDTANAEAQSGDPTSMLELYRRLLTLRRREAALHQGPIELSPEPGPVLVFHRHHGTTRFTVAVNMGAEPASVDLVGDLELSSRPAPRPTFDGTLEPYEAVVLRTAVSAG